MNLTSHNSHLSSQWKYFTLTSVIVFLYSRIFAYFHLRINLIPMKSPCTVHSTVAESGHSCLCSCLCSRSCLRTCSHNRSNMVLRDWKVTFTGLSIHIHSKDMRAGHIALLIHTYIYIYIHTTSCTAQSIKMKMGCK